MPLPVAHGLLGAGIVSAAHPHPGNHYFLPLLAGAFLANLADSDFALAFIFHSKAWHRGFSHSLMFAIVVGVVLMVSFGRRHLRAATAYALAFASHGILDYVTTKEGNGVELLWPFSSARLGLGWVGLSELPSRLPALGIAKALTLEFLLFAPLLVVLMWSRKNMWKDGQSGSLS